MKNLILAGVVIFLGVTTTVVWAEPPATQPAKELTLDLGNKVTMNLVLIPAGKFTMGSPETEKGRAEDEVQHEVTISKPFFMGVTLVTVDQFAAFVKDCGYKTDAEKDGSSTGYENCGWTIPPTKDRRLLVAQSKLRSEGRSSGRAGQLERRPVVLQLALKKERQERTAANRGRVGIRLPGGHEDGISLGGQPRRREGLGQPRRSEPQKQATE
jgi:formylglycine-generating enzyme required for sulfatase activity